MPAKKTASKKRKTAKRASRKAPAKKATKRKTAASKRKVTKKKATKARSKKVAKKKSAKKKAKKSAKKTARKSARKSARKKASKKASKKSSKKRSKKAGKKTARKSARKPASKKSTRKKAAAQKKGTRRTLSSKRPSAKRGGKKTVRRPARKALPRRSKASLLSGPIHGIKPYKMRRGEEYMSSEQLEHFRKILTAWKRELMYEVDRTVHHMQDEAANFPDPNDRATQESEFGLELRTRDRERKLLRKIDSALARIDDGSYGYCDETGEEIGLKRLEARPVATLCLEAQERRELAERQFRDRDDRYR